MIFIYPINVSTATTATRSGLFHRWWQKFEIGSPPITFQIPVTVVFIGFKNHFPAVYRYFPDICHLIVDIGFNFVLELLPSLAVKNKILKFSQGLKIYFRKQNLPSKQAEN